MTWFDADYRRRQIVAIDATGGSGSTATIDVEFVVPEDWDDFWDNIRSNFNDVVVTDSEGNKANFARKAGANYSTRTLTLQIDGLQIKNDDSFAVAYVYFFQPTEATDHSTSVTISSAKTGHIMLSAPHSRIVSQPASQSALDSPIQSFVKASTDEIHVYLSSTETLQNASARTTSATTRRGSTMYKSSLLIQAVPMPLRAMMKPQQDSAMDL